MSSQNDSPVNNSLLQDFLQESLEMLDSLDQLFVALEQKPDDLDIINQIFRPVHSIKGNSAFFNLTNVKDFSHTLESILQDIRNGKHKMTPEITDALLRGIDFLRQMLGRFASGNMGTDLTPEEQAHLKTLARISQSDANPLTAPAREILNAINALTDTPPALAEKLQALRAACEKVLQPPAEKKEKAAPGKGAGKASSYAINGKDVTAQVQCIVGTIEKMEEKAKDEKNLDAFAAAIKETMTAGKGTPVEEVLLKMEDEFLTIRNAGLPFDDLITSLLKEHLDEALPLFAAASPAAESQPKPAEAPKAAAPATAPAQAHAGTAKLQKTLRVPEDTIDTFISYVSELIITGEVFHYLQKHLENVNDRAQIIREFKTANIAFANLSINLQKSIMAIRRVELRQVMQKLPRIVHDTAAQLGKKITFKMSGEELQIDKALVENLEAPLIHMVRNSADHGVEPPEVRAAAGKDPVGMVTLSAEIIEDHCIIRLCDDGKGLDIAAIKKKSVANGLITEDRAATMSDAEAARLIFAAGVSTAKKITDVSGRGVGMDVVLSNITAMNGTIDIASTLGKGTEMTITLPMSLMTLVIDGVLARVGDEQYIIPLTDIRNLIRPSKDQFCSVTEQGMMLMVRDELYRLLRLDDFFCVKGSSTDIEHATIILVESEIGTCGLVVDEILGQQSVVLKNLDKQFKNLKFLRGTAILGDGHVGLVVDIKNLIAAAFNEAV